MSLKNGPEAVNRGRSWRIHLTALTWDVGGVMSETPLAAELNQTGEVRRRAIRESVIAGAALTGPYLAMNVAAAFVAGFGLMENSPAVIIGAMLIAMLFGPIIGIAMALAKAD